MLQGSQLQHGPSATKAPTDPQQRPPVLRQSSTPGAQPRWPRANQACTPPAGPGSTIGSEQAAESATSAPDGRRPRRRMAGSGTEAVALLIKGTGREKRDRAREPGPEACRPAAGRLAPGPSRLRRAARPHAGSGGGVGGVDLQHGLPAPAAARPPRPEDPGREAAPGPHECPCPRHLLRPLA